MKTISITTSTSASDALRERIEAAVAAVADPELAGVTIGGLGLVVSVAVTCHQGCSADTDSNEVTVSLTPTFLGCPALTIIARDVERAALNAGASSVTVVWVHEPPWSTDRISEPARASLAELGIAVPRNTEIENSAVCRSAIPLCPTCGSADLLAAAPVGPTACRSVAWCRGCRSVIEIMRG